MKHAGEVYWDIQLFVDCAVCGENFDANTVDEFAEQLKGAEICEAVRDCSVECPRCNKEFSFDIAGGT